MATATEISGSPAIKLSSNDAAVLQALFDSESHAGSSSSSNLAKIDNSLPPFPSVAESEIQSVKERELAVVRRTQKATEDGNLAVLEDAIREFDNLITEAPKYPPLYANRAQALRMYIQAAATKSKSTKTTSENSTTDDTALFSPQFADHATRLWSDLAQAITLATSPTSPQRQNAPSVSPAQARLLSNAHTHRGYLLLKAAKLRKDNSSAHDVVSGPRQIQKITSRDELEELASRDFFQAGRYGNEVARDLSVQTNPYAKMCGAIVKEALRKEIEEFQ